MIFVVYIPENVLHQIFKYCDADTFLSCQLVSRKFKSESSVAIAAILKYVLTKYYSRGVFENRYFIRPNNQLFLKRITEKRIFVVRGIVTYVLDISKSSWTRCADTLRDRGYFAAVWFKGEIFAIGTYSIIAVGTVEKYNSLANCWIPGPSLPLKLRSACAAVLDDKLYVLGGHDAFTMRYSDAVFIYDDGNTGKSPCEEYNDTPDEHWKLSSTRLLQPRSRHSAIGFEGKIWIAGGCFEENSVVTRSVEIFDPDTKKWVTGPCLKSRRDFANLQVVLGSLYAVGGDVDEEGVKATRTIEVFDKDTNSWNIVTAFKDERQGFSTSSLGSKIYIFGGSSDVDYEINTWDAYDVIKRQWDSDFSKYQYMPVIDCWGQAVTPQPEDISW